MSSSNFGPMGLLACWLVWTATGRAVEPVLRLAKPAHPTGSFSLLVNGDFEKSDGGQFPAWSAARNGFALGEGRSGGKALRCENQAESFWSGASQTLSLNRTEVAPLVVSGWSKAENVNGSPDSGYSLYVDMVYQDGTPLWGQTVTFRTGTHDWQRRELTILPEKPVKSLTLHCLLRGHSGAAWFDDIRLEEVKGQGDELMFEGLPVLAPTARRHRTGRVMACKTGDGLELRLRDNWVNRLNVGGHEFGTEAPSGFLAMDVAARSDLYGFEDGACPELGLQLRSTLLAKPDHIVVEGRLLDTTAKDRAVMLLFALPLDAAGWRWGDDIRRSRPIQGHGQFAHTVAVPCGTTGTMSLYPLAAVYDTRTGLALALDMAQPAQYRLSYHAGTKMFYIAFDFGLVPESRHFPSGADFRFVLFRFDPTWGFRGAFQKLTQIFPDYFHVRSHDQGLWMPFTDISKVEGWEDFGFKYHEGNNNVSFDDSHGILSFRYTEPMTWWMRMAKELPRTISTAVGLRDQLANGPNDSQKRMAHAAQIAGMFDESGQPHLLFRNEPWCDGAVWSLNPNPELPAPTGPAPSHPSDALGAGNAATVHWNPSIQRSLYGPEAKGKLDGEYLDSLEGYVTADLNFRREHFRYTHVPLTFSSETKQPALFKGLAVFEFTKWMSEDVHRSDKLMFANGVPYRFTFLCPWLDVLGTETDWLRQGKYQPPADQQMSLWRAMSGAKPYLLLMNTDFAAFTPELVEKYFQRSLFYGMFPSMFSHNAADNPYWQNPKWYNRDRALFKKYLPLIKRVAEAGWQPVTLATGDNESVWLERFGPDETGWIYFTLLNDSAAPQKTNLRTDRNLARKVRSTEARELISDALLDLRGLPWELTLAPQECRVIRLSGRVAGR